MNSKKLVVAAVIFNPQYDSVLITQRVSKKWEFPGGKVEKFDSTLENALKRELQEELNISTIQSFEYLCDEENDEFIIRYYTCVYDKLGISIREALDYKWVNVEWLDPFEFLDADRRILAKVKKFAKMNKK